MTTGNGAEPSGGEPAAEPDDGSCEEESVGEAVDPSAEAIAEAPPPPRRKAGVEYRPV
ncbi:hypothetical protein [Actinacidiphila sp. bgisy144]|uniref:hypothetical protein n=1 Tax=Actinacidiphila sp. bgisy144 TaxID=3413791 RepID=UPI003EB79E8E